MSERTSLRLADRDEGDLRELSIDVLKRRKIESSVQRCDDRLCDKGASRKPKQSMSWTRRPSPPTPGDLLPREKPHRLSSAIRADLRLIALPKILSRSVREPFCAGVASTLRHVLTCPCLPDCSRPG